MQQAALPATDLSVTATCAPCCWGAAEVKNPYPPPWKKVLDKAAQAGFGGLEPGSYGYLSLEFGLGGKALQAREPRIVAGTIFDDRLNPANLDNLLRQTHEICGFMIALPAPPRRAGGALPDHAASRTYLAKTGF